MLYSPVFLEVAAVAANPYHIIRNETATPIDLWDRGYRRCVALLQKAKVLMQGDDPSQRIEKAHLLHSAFAIVEFWSAALPPESSEAQQNAPESASLSARLRMAYGFIMHRIVKANANDSTSDIDEAMTMLTHLRFVFHKENS